MVQESGLLTLHTRARAGYGRWQRGFGGFFLIVLVAGMTAAAGLFTFYRTDPVAARSERATTDVLAEAKAALIGYAVRSGGPTGTARPGDLPCPDVDGDGIEGSQLQALLPPVTCAAGAVGRIPWRTLGIPEPRDAAGETLWYAISGRFRARSAGNNSALNSDTRGDLAVRGPDGATVLTSSAAAVIIAPGGAIGSQNRRATGVGLVCGVQGTILPKFCPTNYLDTHLSGISNVPSSSTGPFIAAPASASFNDRLMYLTIEEIMPALEMRIGAELKALLQAYRENSNCKCYPWADNWPYSGGIADTGQNRGRFPSLPGPELWGTPGRPGTPGIPDLPQWVAANDWHNFFWYGVGRQNTHDGDGNVNRACRTCSDHPLLRVTDPVKSASSWVSALLFTPGPPLDGIARMNSSSRRNNLTLYLEDSENNDGASSACPDVGEIGDATPSSSTNYKGAMSCDEYVVPRSKSMNRDRIVMVGVATPGTCAANAQTLVNNAPCGWPTVSSTCTAAVTNLDSCTCLDAARTLTRPPCVNTPNPGQCETAVAQLRACTQ